MYCCAGLGNNFIKGTLEEMSPALNADISQTPHIQAIDGHPKHKWDQIKVFREVYLALDSSHSGRLTVLDLESIPDNEPVLLLLRQTVFCDIIKRKQWNFFTNMVHHNQDHVKFLEFVQAARNIASEPAVSIRLLRTQEEHQLLVHAEHAALSTDPFLRPSILSLKGSPVENRYKSYFAAQARQRWDLPSREARIRRLLCIGDCVWAMKRGAGVWLPAVIETINADGSYDVTYPLTLAALHQAKVQASSRQLLALPSLTSGDERMLNPKPFPDERSTCLFVFDLADEGKEGVVDAEVLCELLKSERLNNVVKSSAGLSLLVFGGLQFNLQSESALLDLFVNKYAVDGKISRVIFCEYICALVEIESSNSQ